MTVSPLLIIYIRDVASVGVALSGGLIRNWWKKLPPDEKKKLIEKVYSEKNYFVFGVTATAAVSYLFYNKHLFENALIKEKRLVFVNQEQLVKVSNYQYRKNLEKFETDFLPESHPTHQRISKILYNILFSNSNLKEIRNKKWSVTVVDQPERSNALVLPDNKIYVFTGLLKDCLNDDQLAFILCHEISHCVLSHMAQTMSKTFFTEFLLLIPSFISWIILPSFWAFFIDRTVAYLVFLCVHLPFSRTIEKEADSVGIQLAAKSCYDVREALIILKKLKHLDERKTTEWFSTHPRDETRVTAMKEMIPDAMTIRRKNHCPPLKMEFFNSVSKLTANNKPLV